MSSITVGVYLGKKDRLVRYWYEILPKGQFPMLVKYCIQSYLRNNYFPLQSICDPRGLKEQIQMRGEYVPTQRNVTFTPDDGPVYQWIQGLESGYRSEEIKNILKETVVHTLLNEQPLYSPRNVGQVPYSIPLDAHEAMNVNSYPSNMDEYQKIAMLKRDSAHWEEPHHHPSTHELESSKEKASKGFKNHLVNFLG